MEINRDSYLEHLVHLMHNGTVKVVTGVRRCGKSYLLRTLFHRYLINNGVSEDHIVEIDFVVNLPLGKMYIQSAFNIDDPVRKAAETASLHKTGDFFRKLIVTDGNRKLVTDEDGISYVGVLQFLTKPDVMD